MALKFEPLEGKGELGDVNPGWQVQEYATPDSVSEGAPGLNVATLSGGLKATSIFLNDKRAKLTHYDHEDVRVSLGSFTGDIQSVRLSGASVGISINSVMSKLSVERTAKGFVSGVSTVPRVQSVAANGDYYIGRVLCTTVTQSGRYGYILSSVGINGTAAYLSKIDLKTGAAIWRNNVSSSISAADTRNMVAMKDDSVVLFAPTGNLVRYFADGSGFDVTYVNYWRYPTTQFPSNISSPTGPRLSLTPEGYVCFTYSGTGYSTSGSTMTQTSVYRIQIVDVFSTAAPGSRSILDSGYVTVDTLTNTNGAFLLKYPQMLHFISGMRMVALGPVFKTDDIGRGWGLYSISATGQLTRIKDLLEADSVSSRYDLHVSTQDASGNFLINEQLYNTEGVVYASWKTLVSQSKANIATVEFPNPYSWGHMTLSGRAVYVSWGVRYPMPTDGGTWVDILQWDFLEGITTLSAAFRYYFSLVFGDDFTFLYQATDNPPVLLRGWKGNVWEQLCQLCVVYGLEMVFPDGVPLVRDMAAQEIDFDGDVTPTSITASVVGNTRGMKVAYQQARVISQDSVPSETHNNLFPNPRAISNVTGVVAQYGRVVRDTSAVAGGTSFAVIPDGGGTSHLLYGKGKSIFTGLYSDTGNVNIAPVGQYAIRATLMLPAAQESTVDSYYSRRLVLVQTNRNNSKQLITVSEQAPNAAGTYELVVYGAPSFQGDYTDSMLYLINGSKSVTAYFTNIRIAAGVGSSRYPRETFYDGNSPGWTWDGAQGSSTSKILVPAIEPDNILYSAREDGNRVFSVEAREREEFTVTTNAYPTSFAQPIVAESLNALAGSYYVSGSDNLPVSGRQWKDYGGDLVVTTGDQPNELNFLLIGPVTPIPGVPGPYKLAASDGTNDYAFLTIIGSGLRVDPQEIDILTGVDPEKITREDGGTIDNFAINTKPQAYDVGVNAADTVGSPSSEISFDVAVRFAEKFGVMPGKRFRYGGAKYRVKSCTIKAATVNITATRYTTVSDVISYYGDITTDQIVAEWDGFTGHDAIVLPMKGRD